MLAPNTEVDAVLKAAGGPAWTRLLANRWLWLGVAAILAAAAALYFMSAGTTAKITYKTAPVVSGGLTVAVTAAGTVQPVNQVDVGSVLSGVVDKVTVDYNDRVTAGQILARLDTTKLTAAADHATAAAASADANVTQAKATVTETNATLSRVKTLFGKGFSTKQDLDTAQAVYNRAVAAQSVSEAQRNLAEADLSSAKADLARADITSPINGIVLKRDIDPGQTVAASLSAPVLFTIAEDLAKMQLLVDIDEADSGKIKDGQSAHFTVEAYPEQNFPAQVEQIRNNAQTVNGVVTYQAVLSVDNSELKLRPGMTATAVITVAGKENVLLVPNAALRFTPPSAVAAKTNFNPLGFLTPRRVPGQRAAGQRTGNATQTTGQKRADAATAGRKRIWILEDGEPKPVFVSVGDSDGTNTEVTSGKLAAGVLVIVDATEVK